MPRCRSAASCARRRKRGSRARNAGALERFFKAEAQKTGANHALQNAYAELKIRGQRKLGQTIPKLFPATKPKKGLHRAKLRDYGIEPTASHRYRLIASVPKPEFEAYFKDPDDSEKARR